MRILQILVIVGALGLAGCVYDHDHDHDDVSTIVVQTFSNQQADGDIGFSSDPSPDGTFFISQADATRSVIFGIDADGTEFRAFLDFPLDGSNGGGAVPLGATIISAELDLFVTDVAFVSTVPALLEIVPFPTTGLTSTDFDSLAILTRSPLDFFRSDINGYVQIDVTSLMEEAQRQGLSDLQLRFLLDFVPGASGLVEIDDGVESMAPRLTVEFL